MRGVRYLLKKEMEEFLIFDVSYLEQWPHFDRFNVKVHAYSKIDDDEK